MGRNAADVVTPEAGLDFVGVRQGSARPLQPIGGGLMYAAGPTRCTIFSGLNGFEAATGCRPGAPPQMAHRIGRSKPLDLLLVGHARRRTLELGDGDRLGGPAGRFFVTVLLRQVGSNLFLHTTHNALVNSNQPPLSSKKT